MRVGHAGPALVAKRVRPAVPLLLLLVAAYGPDIVEVALRPFGITNRELSHGLIAVAIGATVTAVGWIATRRGDARDAAAIWLTYASHWPLDFITGHKPTWPGGPTVGLDLYDPWWIWLVELALLAVCGVIWITGRGSRLSSGERRP